MTHELDINLLAALAKQALDKDANGSEYMLQDVYRQTRQAYEQFPEDAVIRQVAFTIERMADRSPPGTTISQAQMSEIYNNFVHIRQNSKFRKVLGHLLREDTSSANSQNPDYTRLNRVDAEDSQLTTDDYLDKNLVNALSGAFGGSMESVKAYDLDAAKKGISYVKAELESIGYAKPQVEVMGGDNQTLVYAAHFDTNKGRVTVAIPIDLSGGKLVLPSTFVADNKLAELSGQNLSYFIDKKSESRDFTVPRVNEVLRAVGILTGRNVKAQDNDFEQISGLFGESEGLAFQAPSIFVDHHYQPAKPELDVTPQAEMPKELAHLARDFEDNLLEAASSFGKEAINTGKRLILAELASAGLKNAQVKFGSESTNSVVYLATINTSKGPVDIEVPVEMQALQGGKHVPLAPALFVYDGTVEDFTGPKLQHFASNLPEQPISSFDDSAYRFMVLPELKNEIMRAAGKEDYHTCEAILSHVADRFSDEDYRNTVSDYQHALLTKNRVERQEQHKCAKMIPAGKGSIYARCGHYGVPMHDVMTNAEGHCILKSTAKQKELAPKSEGVSSFTAKVFMS